MLANLKIILRTCIICRNKYEQRELLRLRYENNNLIKYNNRGRSFYICKECENLIISEELKTKVYKKIEKKLKDECRSSSIGFIQLKEILIDVRYSKSL